MKHLDNQTLLEFVETDNHYKTLIAMRELLINKKGESEYEVGEDEFKWYTLIRDRAMKEGGVPVNFPRTLGAWNRNENYDINKEDVNHLIDFLN